MRESAAAARTLESEGLKRLGRRLRELRGERRWRVQDLARASGVGLSTLYKIEAGRIAPSILTMVRIARSFGRSVAYFTEDGSPIHAERTRAGARERFRRERLGYSGERLSGLFQGATLYGTWLHLDRGGRGEARGGAGRTEEEMAVCLKGRVEFEVGAERFDLGPGDTLHFRTEETHAWRNLAPGGSELILVLSPPPYDRGGRAGGGKRG